MMERWAQGPARTYDPMDLAKNLAQWRDLTPEQWMALANRVLPPLVVLVLIILIAYQAAGLTWRLLESPADQDVVPALVMSGSAAPRAAGPLDALSGWHPFGEPPTQDEPEAVLADELLDAEETTLNLTLHGLAQAQELPERGSRVVPEGGLAVISSGRGGERVYRSGDTIEDASGARLHSVFVDRVLLDRGGRLERLSYPEPDEQVSGGPRLNSNVATRAPQGAAPPVEPSSAVAMADAINNLAPVLAEHMSFAPAQEGGQMIGLRIQPRGDQAVFSELGFEAGDVLTEVNGLALNDLRQTSQVFNALSESSQAQVRIRRNGQEQVLVVNIGQLQQLAESLQ